MVLALAALALVTVACGNGASASAADADAAQTVTVKSSDTMRFEPSAIVVRAGEPVRVTLENTGALNHDLTLVDGVDDEVKIRTRAGSSASATFTIERPGTYTLMCSVPGHEAAGMRGTLIAQ